jgi:CRISPR/Cas system CSM-associated protein Csm5 (group 7 of RAMP superfamily)
MTNRDAKSIDFHESLTLRRNRRVVKFNNYDRRNLDRKKFQRLRHINIKENQKIQNRYSQNNSDYLKSIKMQRSKFFKEQDQRH